jgi:hypothetical protein
LGTFFAGVVIGPILSRFKAKKAVIKAVLDQPSAHGTEKSAKKCKA